MPDEQKDPTQGWLGVGNWLVTKFGPTDAILIAIAGIMTGIVIGWIPSPMLTTLEAIRADQVARNGKVETIIEEHKQANVLLRKICVHDCGPDDNCKTACWQ